MRVRIVAVMREASLANRTVPHRGPDVHCAEYEDEPRDVQHDALPPRTLSMALDVSPQPLGEPSAHIRPPFEQIDSACSAFVSCQVVVSHGMHDRIGES